MPARKYLPTPAESDMAVAFQQCRSVTGWIEQAIALAQKVQAEYMARFEERIGELNPKISQLAREAAAIVGRS